MFSKRTKQTSKSSSTTSTGTGRQAPSEDAKFRAWLARNGWQVTAVRAGEGWNLNAARGAANTAHITNRRR